MRPLSLLLCASLTSFTHAQSSPNLADYLQRHPVDSKGPVISVDPGHVKPTGPGVNLAAFGRRVVAVGNASFIVPLRRVDIDDSLERKPNLYEGLPDDQKLLYLMRSLTDDQWRKVTSEKGLGRGDLAGEQKLVFESLVPQPFSWDAVKIGPNHSMTDDWKKGTLSDAERQQVRLRLTRSVDLSVFLLNPPNASSVLEGSRYRDKEGSWSYQVELDVQRRSTFGLEFKKDVPNVPKPANLDYEQPSLQRTVTLQKSATVRDLIDKVNAVTGLQTIPDFRVGDLLVSTTGGEIQAGSLLKGLAWAVTGTYRKVGSTYVLTSDLTGSGARKLRIAAWERAMHAQTDLRAKEWKKEIGKQPGYSRLDYPKELGMTPALMDAVENQGAESEDVAASALSPALKGLLKQWDWEYRKQPIRKDKVRLQSRIVGQFLLGDGTRLQPSLHAGFPVEFLNASGEAPRVDPQPPVPVTPLTVDRRTKLTFLIATESPTSLKSALGPLAAYPAVHVWIDTHSSAVLQRAVEFTKGTDMTVGWATHIWRAPTRTPDTNLVGLHGEKLNQMFASIAPPWNWVPKVDPVPDWMSPDDPARRSLWQSYAALAQTPGIHGVLLMETQPYGYEPRREQWRSSYDFMHLAVLAHGYSTETRLAFLRKEGIDPIDIGDRTYSCTPDLRQPFFLDDGLRGMPTTYDGRDLPHPKMGSILTKWREFLAQRQLAATKELLNMIDTQPITMELRMVNLNQVPVSMPTFAPWRPGTDLLATGSQAHETPQYEGLVGIVSLPLSGEATNGPVFRINKPDEPLPLILSIDISDPSKIGPALARQFQAANSATDKPSR